MQPPLSQCKNCNHEFSGKYCNACGQKVYTHHDRSMVHFFEEGLHFLTHFEGTLLTTLKTIFSHPGQLSLDYCNGKRKPYFKPLSFFMMLVILYLLFPVFEGLNMKLIYYTKYPFFGEYATRWMNRIMTEKHWTYEQLNEAFLHKGEKTSKFLLLVIIPLTALAFYLPFFKKRPYYFDHLIYSTEVNSFYLLWGFFILPLLLTIFVKILRWTHTILPLPGDSDLTIISYLVLGSFVAVSSRRFYKLSLLPSVLTGVYFSVAHTFIVQYVYKFLLFAFVSKQIH
jgi:hypothetical protein